MKIVRFDAEVGVDVGRFGSTFRLTPLAKGAWMQPSVAHLPAGGRIGRHPAVGPQLLCVVAGSGWVSGGEGVPYAVTAGRGALWDAGEEHETWTDDGLTAVVLEGELDVLATIAKGKPIVVADHDPAWASWFERVRDHIAPALGDLPLSIEHVGSTAVPGLAAKPIIDVDVVVRSDDDLPAVIDALRSVGYLHRGDLGIPGRPAFRHLGDADLPEHHLYAVVEGSKAHLDHVLLRDALRADPALVEAYGSLKRRNAAEVDDDMELYGARKHELIESILADARERRAGP